MTNGFPLSTLLSEKKWAEVEAIFLDALLDPLENAELLLSAIKGLARVGQKGRLQSMAGAAEEALAPESKDLPVARLRWSLLKEAVRAGATPSTPDGFHRLFENAIAAAYPDSPSLATLLGRFKFREAKEPAEGLMRIEKAEKWLPFEVGRCFAMAGRGAGRVVETNYALDSVRIDFEKAKGIAVPIGVAAKSLVPLPPGHFLRDKLTDPKALSAATAENPSGALKRILESFGRALTMTEVKEAVLGLVPEERWSAWWTAAKKHAQIVVHGTGKSATVEWQASEGAADEALFFRFEKAQLKERVDVFRKASHRSPDLLGRMAARLSEEVGRLKAQDPARAFEIAALIEKTPGVSLPAPLEEFLPEEPGTFLPLLADRTARERLLELAAKARPAEAVGLLADWLFREEDARMIETIDRRLAELDPAARERALDKLLKSPRSGPRAFVWFAQRAVSDDVFRARLNPGVLARLLDAVSWDELGPLRTKVRELFERRSLLGIWLAKQASVDEARQFLEALSRHHELEPNRRDGLVAAAEMRFPDLRKVTHETVFVTPEALEQKRLELERILEVEIPENTKGIAIAASEGDLTENFEYKARRARQQDLSVRAGKLQEELSFTRALDPATVDASEVRPGTRVTLSGPGGPRTLTLLGPWDSRPEEGIYSYLSDLGRELLGKTPGDTARVLGEEAVIEKIETWR